MNCPQMITFYSSNICLRNRLVSSLMLALLGCLAVSAAGCDSFLFQEPTTNISRNEALSTFDNAESALYGAYNLTMRSNDTYREFLTYYADLTGGNARVNPGFSAESQTTLRRIAEFNSISSLTVDAYTDLYAILAAVNNVINAVPDLPDATQAEKDRLVGQALGLRAIVHFDLVRLYAQPYTFTEDASHVGVVVLTETPAPFEDIGRSSVQDAYNLITSDLERAIKLLDGGSFDAAFINVVNARALLSRVYLYQGEWARVVTLSNEVVESNRAELALTDELVEMWENDYTRREFLLRLDGSANSLYSLSSAWGNRASDSRPVLTATSDAIDLYAPGDVRGLRDDGLIRPVVDSGDTLFATQKYPEPTTQEPNDVSVIRLSEVYLNRAEAYAELGRPAPARDDLNTIRLRADPSAERVTASGDELLRLILQERRKELAFEGHYLFDRTRRQLGIDRDYCESESFCDEAYPSPRFVLPIPFAALAANTELTQNEGY